jgi:hypothetical protein
MWIGDGDHFVVIDLEGPFEGPPEGGLIIDDENSTRGQEATFKGVR